MAFGLIEHSSTLPRYRIGRSKCHALIDIIVSAIFAVASRAFDWEAIEGFGKDQPGWLCKSIPLTLRDRYSFWSGRTIADKRPAESG